LTQAAPLRRAASDILSAFALLTRLPVPAAAHRPGLAATAWAWPLVGAFAGGVVWGVAALAQGAGLGSFAAAGLALAAVVAVTGAMHEDGLADCADGFWGGWDRARRLEIMKDSRIGTYGVIALVLTLLLRFTALEAMVITGQSILPFMAIGMISRVPMVLVMALLPNARGTGLSQSVGRPSPRTAALAVGLGVAGAVIGLGWDGVVAIGLMLACTLAVTALARAKIGGQTGDVLGAAQQLTETVLLSVFASGIK
jgi:adenosylcobinamide-GDP ribazoletransferase